MTMNRNLYIILVSSILLCTNNLKGQQFLSCPPSLGSQNSILTAPTTIGATASVYSIQLEAYVTTTLTAGNTYKIYTSSSTADPVLTIFYNGLPVAFNDDASYPNGISVMESGVYFSPQYTGIYDMQIDEFGCGNNNLWWTYSDLTVELISTPQPPITIPVVVHVVHYGEAIGTGRNISDAQIHDQIAVLNADFSRSNTDFYLAPPVFAGVSANTNVQFCLAQQDPNGGLTDGIERYLGTQPNYTKTDCDTYLKPNTIWNTEDYFNIWIVDLDGGAGSILFGYAQFPPSLYSSLGWPPEDPNTDGVVMHYKAFGTSPNNFPNLNLGRTVTHEVGHWLGLLHTFAFDCTADDFCDDTPLQGVATQNVCPSFVDLSSVPPSCNSSFPAMYNNFMDYTDDACLNMFTYNQNQIMQYVLATDRNTLLASNGCTPGISIYGCTNPAACNYDLLANTDDGSCDLPNGCGDPLYLEYSSLVTCSDADACLTLVVNGCMDMTACNYNASANVDNSSCDYSCYGCIDSSACNYDVNATIDDGSCDLPNGCGDPLYLEYSSLVTCSDADACLTLVVNGCMDMTACNYNASANVDNSSCDYSCYGCIDSSACNYDVNATIDDGSCYNNLISSISQNGETLSAVTTPIGLNADWYNIQIEDSTSRIWLMEEDAPSFTPTFDCSYFIIVEDGNCSVTSETYYYGENAARIGSFITSPNPTSGLINVKFDNPKSQFVMFELISNNGTKLDEFITIADNLDINLSKYPSGTYYLYFDSEDATQGCRLEEVQKVSTKIILNK